MAKLSRSKPLIAEPGSFTFNGEDVPMRPAKFLPGVGSVSRLPPVIIEGGIKYVAVPAGSSSGDEPAWIARNGELIPIAEALEADRPHELDAIQRMSEAWRALEGEK